MAALHKLPSGSDARLYTRGTVMVRRYGGIQHACMCLLLDTRDHPIPHSRRNTRAGFYCHHARQPWQDQQRDIKRSHDDLGCCIVHLSVLSLVVGTRGSARGFVPQQHTKSPANALYHTPHRQRYHASILPFTMFWLSCVLHTPFSVGLHSTIGVSAEQRSLWRSLDFTLIFSCSGTCIP